MNSLFVGIGAWIKGHAVATVVISTVVVGGAVATPIIINNIEEQNKPKETEKQQEVNTNNGNAEQEKPVTCEDGYELVDNECVKIENEEKEPDVNNKPQEQEKPVNTEKPSNNNSNNNNNNNKPNTNSNTTKPDNKPTENKPEPEQPKEQGLTIKGHNVYYNGTSLIAVGKVATAYYQDSYIETVSYNSNAISNLSKTEKNDIVDNYLCKIMYRNCIYDVVRDKNVPDAIQRGNNYQYEVDYFEGNNGFEGAILKEEKHVKLAKSCSDYIRTGVWNSPYQVPSGYNQYEDLRPGEGCEIDNGYTAEAWDRKYNEYKSWLSNAKKDRDGFKKSFNDFTALWNLLTK